FEIEDFHADIEIQEDSTLVVREEIQVEFSEARHGIFRDLRTEGLEVTVVKVTDGSGKPWNYTSNQQGDFLQLKIGDADKYVDNEQDYHITYQVLGGIRSFEEHDELYWNVTGTDWPVPIQNASATIRLPEGIQEEEALQYQCYTGS